MDTRVVLYALNHLLRVNVAQILIADARASS